jgi:hypothetical protein
MQVKVSQFTIPGGNSHTVESRTVCAAFIFVFGILCQVTSTLDPRPGEADAPQSLRISSIVALLIYASPSLSNCGNTKHRLFTGLVLGILAVYGGNHGGIETRIGDTVYTGLVLIMAINVYGAGGLEHDSTRPDSHDNANSAHRKQTVSALCSGMLLYIGIRGLRQAFSAAENVSTFTTEYTSTVMAENPLSNALSTGIKHLDKPNPNHRFLYIWNLTIHSLSDAAAKGVSCDDRR